jgi:hypothetical protein
LARFRSVLLTEGGIIVTRYIVGFKKEESDYLLKFLFDHMALSQDIQVRVRWAKNTLVVWDVSFSSVSQSLLVTSWECNDADEW